ARADHEAPTGVAGQQDLSHGGLVDARELELVYRLARVDAGDLGGIAAVFHPNVGGYLLRIGHVGRLAEVGNVDARARRIRVPAVSVVAGRVALGVRRRRGADR